MGRARYRFDVGVRYFATVVQARAVSLPSLSGSSTDGAIRLFRITLATPFEMGADDELTISKRMEAVVWVRDDEQGRQFLERAGVAIADNDAGLPAEEVRLWVEFGEPGANDYQPIAEYGQIEDGEYQVEPVIVARRVTTTLGLVDYGRKAIWKGKSIKLGNRLYQVLKALNTHYPRDVSAGQLRREVKHWRDKGEVGDHAIHQAICELRVALREGLPQGLQIPDGEGGAWRLVLSDDADRR